MALAGNVAANSEKKKPQWAVWTQLLQSRGQWQSMTKAPTTTADVDCAASGSRAGNCSSGACVAWSAPPAAVAAAVRAAAAAAAVGLVRLPARRLRLTGFVFCSLFLLLFFIIFNFNSFRFLHTRASRLPPSKFFSCLRFVCCCYCCCCYCYCLFGFLFTGEFQQSSTALNVVSKQQQRKRDPHTEFCIS